MKSRKAKRTSTVRREEKRYNTWCKQAGWLVKTIEDFYHTPSAHGLKWTKGMVKHYKDQYDVLRRSAPRAALNTAREYDARIANILAKFDHVA